MVKKLLRKTVNAVLVALLFLVWTGTMRSQSAAMCFTGAASDCCNSTAVSVSTTGITYTGNTASVNLNIAITPYSLCVSDMTVYVGFGDGSGATSTVALAGAYTFTASHS